MNLTFSFGLLAAVIGIALLMFGEQRWPWLQRWSRVLTIMIIAGVFAAFATTIIPKGIIW